MKTPLIIAAIALSSMLASPALAAENIEITSIKAARHLDAGQNQIYTYVKNNTAENTGTLGRYVLYEMGAKKMEEVASGSLPAIPAGATGLLKVVRPLSAGEKTYEIKVSYKSSAASAKATIPLAETTLSLISLECVTANDDGGTDRIEVRVNMGRASKNFKMTKIISTGKVAKLNGDCGEIEAKGVTVELWEIDPELFGKDDRIGEVYIRRADLGEKTVKLNHPVKGSYWLKYRVDVKK